MSEVRVRKCKSRSSLRFRYSPIGKGSREKGDFSIPELEKMKSINFSFAASVTASDKAAIEQKWNHKLKN